MAFKQSCWKWLCNERILDLQIWEFSLNIKSFVWCLMQIKIIPMAILSWKWLPYLPRTAVSIKEGNSHQDYSQVCCGAKVKTCIAWFFFFLPVSLSLLAVLKLSPKSSSGCAGVQWALKRIDPTEPWLLFPTLTMHFMFIFLHDRFIKI